MNGETRMLCIKVDCSCSYPPDYIYYPKDIIGIHRVPVNDPRAKIGSLWAKGETHCHGSWYSQSCEEEDCIPGGKVVEIIIDCDNCPNKNGCTLKD